MTLLEQLKSDLPDNAHKQRVFLSSDLSEAERIAGQVRELSHKSLRYVLLLQRFEDPAANDPRRAAFDVLIGALEEVLPRLAEMPGEVAPNVVSVEGPAD